MNNRLSWQEKIQGQSRMETKKVSFTMFLMDYFSARNEDEMNERLENMMVELGIKYKKSDPKDYQELAYLLCEVLAYPSSDAADVHCSATRAHSSSDKDRDDNHKAPVFKCPCCDFPVPEPVDEKNQQKILTDNNQVGPNFLNNQRDIKIVRNQVDLDMENKKKIEKQPKQQKTNMIAKYGESFYGYLLVSKFLAGLMTTAFFGFSFYMIITNVIISKAYKDDSNGQITDLASQSYVMPLSFSFGSKQFYSTDFSHNLIKFQSEMATNAVLVLYLTLMAFGIHYKMWKTNFELDKTVAKCSLLCKKIPLSYQQQKLKIDIQNMLDTYYQAHNYEQKYRVKAKIVKTNYAKPYRFQYSVSSEYEKLTELIKIEKKQFKQWIKHRKSHYEFPVQEKQRKNRYNEFKKLRLERYRMHQQMVAENSRTMKEDEKITHADAFITFDSEFVPVVILQAQKEKMTICSEVANVLNPKQILWVAAPEPEDVNWDKFGQRPCERVFRTFVSTVITVGALAGSFIILLGSSKFELYVKGNNAENKDGPIINFLISILLSTPIYLTNFLLTTLLEYLARNWEKHKTNSDVQISLGRKALLVMLINSIAIPVLINIIYKENIYGVGGLAEEVFYFSITNAILSVVLKIKYFHTSYIILQLKIWYSRWVCNKWDSTQKQLNVASEYLFFEHGLEYASLTFTFLYSCFFLSLQPIIGLFTAIQITLIRLISCKVLISMYKSPSISGHQINDSLSKILRLGPLFFTLGSILWTDLYASSANLTRQNNYIALAVSILTLFDPWDRFQVLIQLTYQYIHKKLEKKETQEAEETEVTEVTTQSRVDRICHLLDPERVFRQDYQISIAQFSYVKQKWQFNSEYDRLNPITAHEAIQKYNNEVAKNRFQLPQNISRKTPFGYRQNFGYDDQAFIRYDGLYLLV